MTLPTYSTGTIGVTNGGTVVTGASTLWSGTNVKEGDFFVRSDGMALITEVTNTTHLKITPWLGATVASAGTYTIEQNYSGRVVGVAAAQDVGTMLGKLHTDGLPFLVGLTETVPDPSLGADGQYAYKPDTGAWWVKTAGVWVLSSDPANAFVQAGTGAVTRTMQNKAREIVSVTDYGTATQAVAASGGGTIIVPNGTAAPTLPASYPNVLFDYDGPLIPARMYSETASDSTANRLFRSQNALSVNGTAQNSVAIESRPIGANLNGPAQGNYALGISSIKQNWLTTTQPGEIGGLNVVIRNGGISGGNQSDSSALLANVQTIGPSGYASGVEGSTSNIAVTTFALLKQVSYALGAIDAVTGDSNGLVLTANAGSLVNGLLITALASASFAHPILCKDNAGVAQFSVDSAGNIVGNDLTITGTGATAYTPTATPQTTPGTFAYTATGFHKKAGKHVEAWGSVVISTLSTAAGVLSISLPFAVVSGMTPPGSAVNASLAKNCAALASFISSSSVSVFFDGGVFPATGAHTVHFHVTYMTP